MAKIAVASGKGGTGKTLIATLLSRFLPGACIVDADVEAPNAGLLLRHQWRQQDEVYRPIPRIDSEWCYDCGLCVQNCRFHALMALPTEFMLLKELCHSCGVCTYSCPNQAITEMGEITATITTGSLDNDGTLIAGRLRIGEASPVYAIEKTKAAGAGYGTVIVDCPPGASCAMMAAIADSDYCLLVTEPSPFGLHDLELALEAVRIQGIPHGVVVNRWRGDNLRFDKRMAELGVQVLAVIPFRFELARAYSKGADILEAVPEMMPLFEALRQRIEAEIR